MVFIAFSSAAVSVTSPSDEESIIAAASIVAIGFAVSVPAICANVIFLLKETSVFSAVSLADLMYVTKDLIGMYYNTWEALLMLVTAYLIIILPISAVFSVLERRLRRAGN